MPHPMPAFSIQDFRKNLLTWFRRDGKTYPWRETEDPWHILVSEIMLQQTTIPTVLARYSEWMHRFPSPLELAQATEEQALRSWEGLGYYRRVRSLQATARAVVEQYDGIFPRDKNLLMQLPGIGEYTAGAVLSFAFNIPAPIVDANVSRVIARLDNYRESVDSTPGKKYMWKRAEELVDRDDPRRFNSAIMELGQTYCKPQGPDCLLCPVRPFCSAENPDALPVKTPRPETTRLVHHDIICINGETILMEKQEDGKRHEGMYRFPQRTEQETSSFPIVMKQNYSVTRYKITRFLHLVPPAGIRPEKGESFVSLDAIEDLPLASPDRKVLSSQSFRKILRERKSS